MRSCALATKAGRLAIFLLVAAFCLPALASLVYVPVSPTVVAQTADPQVLSRKVSEAPFGNFRTPSHPGGDCGGGQNTLTCQAPLTYTGHLYDQESGLFYFGARYYDPETGRFLSQDPVAGDALNPPSLHKYLYAYSSPMNYTDPWGEESLGEGVHEYSEEQFNKKHWYSNLGGKALAVGGEFVYGTFEFASGGAVGKIDTAQEQLDRGEISNWDYWQKVGHAGAETAVTMAAGAGGGALVARGAQAVGLGVRATGALGGMAGGVSGQAGADVYRNLTGEQKGPSSIQQYAISGTLGAVFGYAEGVKAEAKLNTASGDEKAVIFQPENKAQPKGADRLNAANVAERPAVVVTEPQSARPFSDVGNPELKGFKVDVPREISGEIPGSSIAPEPSKADVAWHKHHTIPREVRSSRATGDSLLPEHLVEHPDIVGRAGNPNKWRIPAEEHLGESGIHNPNRPGGDYNYRWREELRALEEARPNRSTWTAEDITSIRDKLVREFNIERYRPNAGNNLETTSASRK